MPLTEEQARIAKAIETEHQRLVRQGKSQITILGAMQEYMPGFKLLLDANVVQEAANRYPGFRQFAKILERTAQAIQSGAIAVPGKQAAPRQNDPMIEHRKQAAAIDLHMRQLAADGVPVTAVIDRMTGHLLELHKIWTSTTDDQLAILCREFPGFHRYAVLMEAAAEAERQKPARPYDGLPELPDALKEHLSALLGTAAKLESDYHAVFDAAGTPGSEQRVMSLVQLHSHWRGDLARFKAALQSAGMPHTARDIILTALERMERRIVELEARIQAD